MHTSEVGSGKFYHEILVVFYIVELSRMQRQPILGKQKMREIFLNNL